MRRLILETAIVVRILRRVSVQHVSGSAGLTPSMLWVLVSFSSSDITFAKLTAVVEISRFAVHGCIEILIQGLMLKG